MKEITAEEIGDAVNEVLDKEAGEYSGGQLPPWGPNVWVSLGIQRGIELILEAMKPDDIFIEGHGEYK